MKTIPITLLTGFLGAGKSTLINRILKEKPDTRFGLIVNEFGDVNLESQVLETSDEEIVELSNGCMCCVVRKDIVAAVEKILASKNPVDYILVEASGLSDPIPIAQTFLMNDLDGKVRLDAVLCLVDAENFEHNMEQFQIAYTQLQAADIVLLSKTDLIDKPRKKKIEAFLAQAVPNIALVPLDASFHTEQVIDTSQFDHTQISELEVYDEDHDHEQIHAHKSEDHDHHAHESHDHADKEDHDDADAHHAHDEKESSEHGKHYLHSHDEEKSDAEHQAHDSHEADAHNHDDHDHDEEHSHENHEEHADHDEHEHHEHHHHAHEHVDTVFFKSDKPLDYKKFSTFITTVPQSVIRAKGFLWFDKTAEEDLKFVLQFVGARCQLSYKPWSDNEKRQSAVVFIGKHLEKKKLLAGIFACVQEAAR